jgi:hypothetical protein
MKLTSRLAARAVSLAAAAVAQAIPAYAQNPPQPPPPLQTGISTDRYGPLDPRKYPDENPLEVVPLGRNVSLQPNGSLQCTAPDPSWRLLERYDISCLYAVPLLPAERKVLDGYALVPAGERDQRERAGGYCMRDPWSDTLIVCGPSPVPRLAPVVEPERPTPEPQPDDPYAGVPGYIPGGYNPCFNPNPPPQCPSQTADVGRPSDGGSPSQAARPSGDYACRACGPQKLCRPDADTYTCVSPTPPSGDTSRTVPADDVVLCGNATAATAISGADIDEYAKTAKALTEPERQREIQRSVIANPQGPHPWCAVAAAKTVIGAWHVSNGADVPTLVGELDQILSGSSAPVSPEHGYTLEQAAKLLRSRGLQTQVSNVAGSADPIGTLATATRVGPVILGVTLTRTAPGWFGRPTTVAGPHAIVVDRVQGRAPNRQVRIIDSVQRPTGTTWSFYYWEPEAEFSKAWRLNGASGMERQMLQSHLPGR